MGKVSYSSLKLKTNTDVKTFDFNGQTIEVLQYLPIEKKYDLVMVTLQKSEEDGIYNELKLDMFFHLNIVYEYTNISFTDKQRENETKLYDCIKSSGLLDKVIEQVDDIEYNDLFNSMEKIIADIMKYSHSAAGVIENLIHDLPTEAAAAAEIVDNFNPEQYQAVTDFARAANGGRPVPAK